MFFDGPGGFILLLAGPFVLALVGGFLVGVVFAPVEWLVYATFVLLALLALVIMAVLVRDTDGCVSRSAILLGVYLGAFVIYGLLALGTLGMYSSHKAGDENGSQSASSRWVEEEARVKHNLGEGWDWTMMGAGVFWGGVLVVLIVPNLEMKD
jgi:predicted membrane channel-forming protein YqfA (hemolysin III family)